MDIQERLKLFLQEKSLSYKQFEEHCGLGNGTAARLSENTRGTILGRISKAFPELNTDWLMTGEGNMLRTAVHQHIGDVHQSSLHEVNVVKGDPDAYNTLLRIVEANQKTTEGFQRSIERFQDQVDKLIEILQNKLK